MGGGGGGAQGDTTYVTHTWYYKKNKRNILPLPQQKQSGYGVDITDVWIKLLNAVSSYYRIGHEFVKRDSITLLLELYTLRQINSCLSIETCLKL